MKTTAKNVATLYPAPHETLSNAAGVRIVDLHAVSFIGLEIEYCTYEGTQDDLICAGLVPAEAFDDVPKCGKLSARLEHSDGTQERIRLSRRSRGLWRTRRQRVTV